MATYSIKQLQDLKSSKQELFADLTTTFDYALPQDWLNHIADFAAKDWFHKRCTYDLIRSTTVWNYPQNYSSGEPATVCKEVQSLIEYFNYSRIRV